MARSPSTRWYSALAALIVFVLLAWLLGAVLALTDGERVTLRVGLVALGLIAACLLLWYLRPQEEQPAAPPSDKGGPDVLAAVTAARARLPRGVFNSRAMVLVLGPEGSCKTTLVSQSGLDPEILASDAGARGRDAPIPTGAGNFWLVKDAVLAEAGAAAFTDAALWRKLIRALRAPRFAAAFGRGQSAPRSAVVCVSCDLFFGGNAHAQMEGLAQVTRQRLTQAAREFGVALPVYVVFTKADRLPNFEAWVAPLTNDEVRAPVGAALPFDESAGGGAARARAAGTYADRIVPRLEAAFARVTSALAQRRVDLRGRESVGDTRLQAYELPRELGKLTQEATRFLLEICRPMQLGVSPQLRGFYFVGARPIVVTDQAPPSTAAAKASSSAKLSASDATAVFVSAASPDAE
ncbi:MAG: type VI secretion protein IcmF/TssM N-terminal domain-containing protein, partial [Gemmatimonadaceae bacterium]